VSPSLDGSRPQGRGVLADNVLHFSRVLRTAGVPLGTDRILLALEALQTAELCSRAEFQATLRCCLIDRKEHLPLFDQAFAAFWRDPDLLGRLLRLRLPQIAPLVRAAAQKPNQRLAGALAAGARAGATDAIEREMPPLLVGHEFSWSDRETLRKADFDSMTRDEWNAARRLIARLDPALPQQRSRRREPAARGRVDMRAALRRTARHAGELPRLPRALAQVRPAPLVLLIDISGSMSRYSRMLLHFAQALCSGAGAAGRRVHVFVFGTRLTEVTRRLAARDPDEAITAVLRVVNDWAGGTRIARALAEFNRHWLNRTGGTRATVVLATDGLDHADFDRLAAEMRHLHLGCRQLLWLNPLLRYERFEARARGVRAMLPHVDRLLPVHNLASLDSLGNALGARARTETAPWR
jgi:uncharacterized protein with von Willebrand factor type A (vWA) domain